MEYQRAIKYLIDRRLKLILLSSKVGREKEYFEDISSAVAKADKDMYKMKLIKKNIKTY